MPFVVDAPGWGRNVEQLLQVAPDILAADPLHNVIFSWHMYDSGNAQAARIDTALDTAAAQKIPFIFGEFGSHSPGACHMPVPYQSIITKAQARGVGYLPWSWDNMNSEAACDFDMVSDGIHLSTLKPGWASEVAVTDPASIQKTSKRTAWQTNPRGASCAAGPASVPGPT